jgi:RNA polymerase sigma-70 factor, ECF subfamily
MTAEQDAADAASVVAGNPTAFEGIVTRWQGPILNLAWRSSRHRESAEDLAQEIFLHVFRALPSWRGKSRFSTWLFAIAVNHLRSRARRAEIRLDGIESAFDLPDPRESSDVPEGARIDALRRAVRGLPAKYQEAILLHYFQGRDVRGASALLGVRTGTFKARLARARALLDRMLTPGPRENGAGKEA